MLFLESRQLQVANVAMHLLFVKLGHEKASELCGLHRRARRSFPEDAVPSLMLR